MLHTLDGALAHSSVHCATIAPLQVSAHSKPLLTKAFVATQYRVSNDTECDAYKIALKRRALFGDP